MIDPKLPGKGDDPSLRTSSALDHSLMVHSLCTLEHSRCPVAMGQKGVLFLFEFQGELFPKKVEQGASFSGCWKKKRFWGTLPEKWGRMMGIPGTTPPGEKGLKRLRVKTQGKPW